MEHIKVPEAIGVLDYATATIEDWHIARRSGWGGSDAAAIMGMDRWSSAFVKCCEKSGRIAPFDGNEATYMGSKLESFIRRELLPDVLKERQILADVLDPTCMYQNRYRPWQQVNVDGFLRFWDGRLVGLEIKYHGGHRLKEYGGVDGTEVPDAYYCQAQHGMAVTGLEEWYHFAVEGHRRILRVIPRNPEFIDRLNDTEQALWSILQADDLLLFPAPGGTDADAEALQQLAVPQSEDVADLSDVENSVDEYVRLGAEIKSLDKLRETYRQKIQRQLGSAKRGETDRYSIRQSLVKRRTFDVEKFRKDHPSLTEEYTKTTDSLRLTVGNTKRGEE